MSTVAWNNIRIKKNESLQELFHENSKRIRAIDNNINESDLSEHVESYIPASLNEEISKEIETPIHRIFKNAFDHIDGINPIELFIYIPQENRTQGLFHLSHDYKLRMIKKSLCTSIKHDKALVMFTAQPRKLTQIYGERGYRLTLIKTGQIIQNLIANSKIKLELFTGYSDFDLEEYLGIDGVVHTLIETYSIDLF